MSELKHFKDITDEERSIIECGLIESINTIFPKEELSENFFKYEIKIQDTKFVTAMSSDELKESAKLTIDIIEELKNINNNGLNRAELEKIEKEVEAKYVGKDEVMKVMEIWNRISTERLSSLIYELDCVRRVGGAWAIFLANPCVKSAIYSVYDRLVDSFDDEELYELSAYFLLRAVMHMHSDEIE